MARFPNSLKRRSSVVATLLALALPAAAVEVPAGTELHIRLKTKVATNISKPKDAVEAVVIAPVVIDGQFLIPAGSTVHGAVETVKPSAKPDERAVLDLKFTELDLDGQKVKIATKLTTVDNARESVDEQGQIQGILAAETISARLDAGIGRVAERYSGLADVLGAAKGALLKTAESDIAYEPGVEMDLTLTAPLSLQKVPGPGPAAKLQSLTDAGLIDLALKQPFQTVAQNPPKPSDITNMMLIGTQAQVEAAFQAAGWSTAASLSAQSKLETFRAIAEQRGYKEAPVSILLLEGNPPDLVFEKQNNTFAQRHHLRVWRRPATYRDRPLWVIAATHDIGIDFSEQNRTFIHKIDPQIDRERAKVVNDLVLTGLVEGLALVDRPDVPKKSANATGDALETDGQVAILLLR
jgi:LssY-like putative type I secretion system component LssY